MSSARRHAHKRRRAHTCIPGAARLHASYRTPEQAAIPTPLAVADTPAASKPAALPSSANSALAHTIDSSCTDSTNSKISTDATNDSSTAHARRLDDAVPANKESHTSSSSSTEMNGSTTRAADAKHSNSHTATAACKESVGVSPSVSHTAASSMSEPHHVATGQVDEARRARCATSVHAATAVTNETINTEVAPAAMAATASVAAVTPPIRKICRRMSNHRAIRRQKRQGRVDSRSSTAPHTPTTRPRDTAQNGIPALSATGLHGDAMHCNNSSDTATPPSTESVTGKTETVTAKQARLVCDLANKSASHMRSPDNSSSCSDSSCTRDSMPSQAHLSENVLLESCSTASLLSQQLTAAQHAPSSLCTSDGAAQNDSRACNTHDSPCEHPSRAGSASSRGVISKAQRLMEQKRKRRFFTALEEIPSCGDAVPDKKSAHAVDSAPDTAGDGSQSSSAVTDPPHGSTPACTLTESYTCGTSDKDCVESSSTDTKNDTKAINDRPSSSIDDTISTANASRAHVSSGSTKDDGREDEKDRCDSQQNVVQIGTQQIGLSDSAPMHAMQSASTSMSTPTHHASAPHSTHVHHHAAGQSAQHHMTGAIEAPIEQTAVDAHTAFAAAASGKANRIASSQCSMRTASPPESSNRSLDSQHTSKDNTNTIDADCVRDKGTMTSGLAHPRITRARRSSRGRRAALPVSEQSLPTQADDTLKGVKDTVTVAASSTVTDKEELVAQPHKHERVACELTNKGAHTISAESDAMNARTQQIDPSYTGSNTFAADSTARDAAAQEGRSTRMSAAAHRGTCTRSNRVKAASTAAGKENMSPTTCPDKSVALVHTSETTAINEPAALPPTEAPQQQHEQQKAQTSLSSSSSAAEKKRVTRDGKAPAVMLDSRARRRIKIERQMRKFQEQWRASHPSPQSAATRAAESNVSPEVPAAAAAAADVVCETAMDRAALQAVALCDDGATKHSSELHRDDGGTRDVTENAYRVTETVDASAEHQHDNSASLSARSCADSLDSMGTLTEAPVPMSEDVEQSVMSAAVANKNSHTHSEADTSGTISGATATTMVDEKGVLECDEAEAAETAATEKGQCILEAAEMKQKDEVDESRDMETAEADGIEYEASLHTGAVQDNDVQAEACGIQKMHTCAEMRQTDTQVASSSSACFSVQGHTHGVGATDAALSELNDSLDEYEEIEVEEEVIAEEEENVENVGVNTEGASAGGELDNALGESLSSTMAAPESVVNGPPMETGSQAEYLTEHSVNEHRVECVSAHHELPPETSNEHTEDTQDESRADTIACVAESVPDLQRVTQPSSNPPYPAHNKELQQQDEEEQAARQSAVLSSAHSAELPVAAAASVSPLPAPLSRLSSARQRIKRHAQRRAAERQRQRATTVNATRQHESQTQFMQQDKHHRRPQQQQSTSTAFTSTFTNTATTDSTIDTEHEERAARNAQHEQQQRLHNGFAPPSAPVQSPMCATNVHVGLCSSGRPSADGQHVSCASPPSNRSSISGHNNNKSSAKNNERDGTSVSENDNNSNISSSSSSNDMSGSRASVPVQEDCTGPLACTHIDLSLLAFPDGRVVVERFTPQEMLLRRCSLDDGWGIALRYDWNARALVLTDFPTYATHDVRCVHPFVRLYQSRPLWLLQEVNGVHGRQLNDVVAAMRKSLTAHFVFRRR